MDPWLDFRNKLAGQALRIAGTDILESRAGWNEAFEADPSKIKLSENRQPVVHFANKPATFHQYPGQV
jgi:hypothetical protein